MSMRMLTLLFGFAIGAFLMWKVAPAPAAVPACAFAQGCTPAAAGAPPAGLRVVVYDPLAEPNPEGGDTSPHFPGWSSAETDGIRGPARAAASPPARPAARFRLVGLGHPGAQGACAVLDGRRLRCLALFDPAAE
jgi:hypothetical protein